MKPSAMDTCQGHAELDDVAVVVGSVAVRGDGHTCPRNTVQGTTSSLADAAAEETSEIPMRSGKGVAVVDAADERMTVDLGSRAGSTVVGWKRLGSGVRLHLCWHPPKK